MLQYLDDKIIKSQLEYAGHLIKFMSSPKTKDYITSVKENGLNLYYSYKNGARQTREMILEAIKQNYRATIYIKNQTEKLQSEILDINAKAFSMFINPSINIINKALSLDGLNLQYVSNPSNEMIENAIKQNGMALEFVTNQTDSLIDCALKQNALACVFIKNKDNFDPMPYIKKYFKIMD